MKSTESVAIKNWIKIYSVNPLHLTFTKLSRCFQEINGNKYTTLVPTKESKEKIKNMNNCGLISQT